MSAPNPSSDPSSNKTSKYSSTWTHAKAKSAKNIEEKGLENAPKSPEKSLSWLGMQFSPKEAQRLYQTIIQSIGTEIQKDQQAMIQAMKNMREDMEDQS